MKSVPVETDCGGDSGDQVLDRQPGYRGVDPGFFFERLDAQTCIQDLKPVEIGKMESILLHFAPECLERYFLFDITVQQLFVKLCLLTGKIFLLPVFCKACLDCLRQNRAQFKKINRLEYIVNSLDPKSLLQVSHIRKAADNDDLDLPVVFKNL